MSTLKLRDVKKDIANLFLKNYLKKLTKDEGVSMRKLSTRMGMHKDFLYDKCKKGDLTGTEMVIISNYLDVNIMELYMSLLHETCRPTRWEKALKTELDVVKKELDDVKKERDWLKGVVDKRV